MKFVHAKFVKVERVQNTYDGKISTKYVFTCQETDLDGSLIPIKVTTSIEDSAKVLEKYIEDRNFHLIPIKDIQVNNYNEGKNTLKLSDDIILHSDFLTIFDSVSLDLA